MGLKGLPYIPMFAIIYYAAYWLRFDGDLSAVAHPAWRAELAYSVLAKYLCFGFFGCYYSTSRHLTFHDLVALIKAVTASSIMLTIGDYMMTASHGIPRSVFLFDWGGTIMVIGAMKAVLRVVQEPSLISVRFGAGTPVLIAGAGDNGEALLRTLRRTKNPAYAVVGFTAEDESLIGATMGGVPIVGTIDQTCHIARHRNIRNVLVAGDGINGKQLRSLVDEGFREGIEVKVLPSYKQLIDGTIDLVPRNVSIEDLLCRQPVRIDQLELSDWLGNRVLMVTGSAGSIGSEICRQLLNFRPRQMVLVDRWENGQFHLDRELSNLVDATNIEIRVADVADRKRMDQLMKRYRPDVIFHTAAYKHVPLMEQNPGEAVKNIVVLTSQLADLAHEHNVQSFVMVSTDKAVNPTNVMGACKRVAEMYVQSLSEVSDCHFVTVRFGNVLGSAGSVVPVFREQIAAGGPVTVTHPDMVRFFMTIPEATQLVIQAGAMGGGGEIFVLDMGEPVKIVDLAKDMIRLSGLREGEDIEIEYTGTRAGEKMFEELNLDSERQLPTTHPKIQVVHCNYCDRVAISQAVKRLRNAADLSGDLVADELRRIVPEFRRAASQPIRRMVA